MTVPIDVDGRNQAPHVPGWQVGNLGTTERVLQFAGVDGAAVVKIDGAEEGEDVLVGFVQVVRQHLELLGHGVRIFRKFRDLVVVEVGTDSDDGGTGRGLSFASDDQLGVESNATAEERADARAAPERAYDRMSLPTEVLAEAGENSMRTLIEAAIMNPRATP